MTRLSLHITLALGWLTALLTLSAPVHGAPPSWWPVLDEEGATDPIEPAPLSSQDGARLEGGSSVSLGIALGNTSDGRRDLRGTLLVELPTMDWLGGDQRNAKSAPAHQPKDLPGSAAADSTRPATAAEEEPCEEEAAEGEPRDGGRERARPSAIPTFQPRDVRAAMRAAVRAQGLPRLRSRLDDLANRARWSAALPRLRIRVTSLMDEDQRLSPTSYDAHRTTASDGSSLWLEGRATWFLDRALFDKAEIRLERLRHQLAQERRRAKRRVLDLLFAWQQAVAGLLDPAADFEQCREAWLQEQQLAVELDLATHGWFSSWSRRRDRRPTVDCVTR